MTHTELIRFIIEELGRNGIVLHTHREVHAMLLPNIERTSGYDSNWSNWRDPNRRARINNSDAKRAIAARIGFDASVWDSNTATQKQAVRDAIARFVLPKPRIDLSDLIPQNTPLTDEQRHLLDTIRDLDSASVRKNLQDSSFCSREPENQLFLLTLLEILYAKGMYDTLIDLIFPALLPYNAEKTYIKIFKAHTYGSLSEPDYLNAALLLETIDARDDKTLIEVKTGALSNLRRYMLENETISKEKLLQALPAFIRHYTELFNHTEKHHYYPGVNLAYMLTLMAHLRIGDPVIDLEDELRHIRQDSVLSIADDKRCERNGYYAKISEIELCLLMHDDQAERLLEELLQIDMPNPSEVERTLRMMRFFVHTLERFSEMDASDLIERFCTVIDVMEEYVTQNG